MVWPLWDREERLAVAADRWLARLHKDSSPATVQRFQRWRDQGPSHRRAVETAEANWRALGKISPAAAAQARDEDVAGQGKPVGKLRFAMAAAMLLAVGGGVLLYEETSRVSTASPELIAGASARRIHLRDGSTVTLDRDTAIAVRFNGDFRAILLERGRARFSVFHDPAHPFVVTAGDRTITARGTVFDVTRRGSRVVVAMLDGVVEVQRRGDKNAKPARLVRGQQLVANAAAESISAAPPKSGDWTQGLQRLDNLPLGEILAKANRSAAKPIILADPALDPLPVQGQLKTSDTRALAAQLAAALDLDLRDEPDGYVLTRKR